MKREPQRGWRKRPRDRRKRHGARQNPPEGARDRPRKEPLPPDSLRGLDIALAVGLVIIVLVVGLVYRTAVLDLVRELYCDPTGCADVPLALTGWLLAGGPLIGVALLYVFARPSRGRTWGMVAALTVMAGAAATSVQGRNPPAPTLQETHPEIAAFNIGVLVAIGAMVLGALIVKTAIPDSAGNPEQVGFRRMMIIGGLQLVTVTVLLVLVATLP